MEFGSSKDYIGNELEIFSHARNWGKYLAKQVLPYVGGTVIEVGAGMGTRTKIFCNAATKYLATEPDFKMYSNLANEVRTNTQMQNVEPLHGILQNVPEGIFADSLIYIDVLEHIEADQEQLEIAMSKIRPGGYLVVLSPAHQWLFTDFDRAIGHFRRYSKKSLLKISPPDSDVICVKMLDSFGMLASLGNCFFLNNAKPSKDQILVWDRLMVPISNYLDRILDFSIGKSILVVWKKKQ